MMGDNIQTAAQDAQHLREQLIKIDNKPYMGKDNAVTLFRRDYPISEGKGVIKTTMLSAEPPIFMAEIIVNGVMVASGHAAPEGKTSTFRKVESAAIRRALDNAGYGAKSIIERIGDLIGVEDAKKMLGSGGNGQNRRMGNEPPPEPEPPQPPAPKPAALRTPAPRGSSNPPPSAFKTHYKPKYGEPPPTQTPMPESIIVEYIKVLPKDIEPGDVIDPEDGRLPVLVSSIEKIDAGTILVLSEVGALRQEIKYALSNGLAHVVGGVKLDAYKRNRALAPKNGAGHPLWAGYESEQDKAS